LLEIRPPGGCPSKRRNRLFSPSKWPGADLSSEDRKDLQLQITALLPKLEAQKAADLVCKLQTAEGWVPQEPRWNWKLGDFWAKPWKIDCLG
jgi:hypothetical protein